METYESQTFAGIIGKDLCVDYRNVVFRNCYFQGCSFSVTRNPRLRSKAKNMAFNNCSQRGCMLGPAVLEDVVVDGFKTNGLFQVLGAAFKHVTLRGKIDRLMISSLIAPGIASEEEQHAFDKANKKYYRKVDWAHDISEGDFKELSFRGFPAHLVRRDPATQVMITRKKALEGRWKDLGFADDLWPFTIQLFLQEKSPSTVLVAAKRGRNFKERVSDLMLLREAGVAEPD